MTRDELFLKKVKHKIYFLGGDPEADGFGYGEKHIAAINREKERKKIVGCSGEEMPAIGASIATRCTQGRRCWPQALDIKIFQFRIVTQRERERERGALADHSEILGLAH